MNLKIRVEPDLNGEAFEKRVESLRKKYGPFTLVQKVMNDNGQMEKTWMEVR